MRRALARVKFMWWLRDLKVNTMTLGWVIAGTIAQLMLGMMSFLLVAFSAAGGYGEWKNTE